MLAKLLRRLGWLAYVVAVLMLFVLAGYWSFSLFVRRGATTVPEIEGLPLAQARARLSDAGLGLATGAEGERYDEEIPVGHVLRQDPGGGSLVKRGSEVEVLVSLGPEMVAVPELAGVALPAAQLALNAAGLTLASTASIYSASGLPGTVVEQDPPAGARVSRSTPVRLFLSREGHFRTFVMPDLVYREFAEVRHFFARRGLQLGSVKFEAYEGIAPGVVLRQFPLAGHPLRQGEVISLVVAGGGGLGS